MVDNSELRKHALQSTDYEEHTAQGIRKSIFLDNICKSNVSASTTRVSNILSSVLDAPARYISPAA